MYVACPACKSVYVIQPAHLRAAGGELRCGACGEQFNATAAVFDDSRQALAHAEQQQQQGVAREIDDLVDRALVQVAAQDALAGEDRPREADEQPIEAPTPTADAAEQQQREAGPEMPVSQREADADSDVGGVQTTDAGQSTGAASESVATLISHVLQVDRDLYAQPAGAEFGVGGEPEIAASQPPPGLLLEEPSASGVGWGAIFAGIFLIVLLCGQLTWQHRYRLADVREWRPLMDRFCATLHCDLPLRREPAKMEMLEREVRDHPVVSGALLINAAFVNRAPFAQVYPVFQISFSNVSGTLVAVRRFAPAEYLTNADMIAAGIQAGEEVRVALEVIDPGAQAVSFQFEFF